MSLQMKITSEDGSKERNNLKMKIKRFDVVVLCWVEIILWDKFIEKKLSKIWLCWFSGVSRKYVEMEGTFRQLWNLMHK